MEGGKVVEAIRKLFHEQMSTKAVRQWGALQASNAAYTSVLLLQMQGDITVADVVEKCVLRRANRPDGLTDGTISERRKSSRSGHFAASCRLRPGRTSQKLKLRSMRSERLPSLRCWTSSQRYRASRSICQVEDTRRSAGGTLV